MINEKETYADNEIDPLRGVDVYMENDYQLIVSHKLDNKLKLCYVFIPEAEGEFFEEVIKYNPVLPLRGIRLSSRDRDDFFDRRRRP